MFAWGGTSNMPREDADRFIALTCAMQMRGLSLRDATGWTSPSHGAAKDAERFADWLGEAGPKESETRRRALLAATDLAKTSDEWDDVLTAAKWMTGFVTGTGK